MVEMPVATADEKETPRSAALGEFERPGGVTWRVVLLCLLLAGLFGCAVPILELKWGTGSLEGMHLPPGAIAVLLFMLLVVNPLLRFLRQNWGFRRNELLTIYIVSLFATLTPGVASTNFVAPLVGAFYYASPENKWLSMLTSNLKPWFTPALSGGRYNPEIAKGWYLGLHANESIPWAAWLLPLACWGLFLFAVHCMLACLAVMLRAQWAEREVLSFPLLELPLSLTADSDSLGPGSVSQFFHSRAMWAGFGIAATIHLCNGLNYYFSAVPQMPLLIDTAKMFSEPPWNQIGGLQLLVWPMVVGVTYLLTTEVSLSLWFFFLFFKFQLVLAYYLGYVPDALPPALGSYTGAKAFAGFQQTGAFLCYAAITLWIGRVHFAHIARRAFGRAARGSSEKEEALSYPVAFWGFSLCFVFVVGWTAAAGVGLLAAFVLWCFYLAIALVLSRVLAEGGLLMLQQGWVPLGTVAQLTGSGAGTWLPVGTLVPASFVQITLMLDLSTFSMPSFLQGFKLARDHQIRARPLLALILAVIAISMTLSAWVQVRLGYEIGGLRMVPRWYAEGGVKWPASQSVILMNGAEGQSWTNWCWMGVGAASIYGMVLARTYFLWFPLHPIGYLVALTHPINKFWCSIFIGWACKTLILRFGGSEAYRKLLPAFLGLILGDVVMILLWVCIDLWQGRVGHGLMP